MLTFDSWGNLATMALPEDFSEMVVIALILISFESTSVISISRDPIKHVRYVYIVFFRANVYALFYFERNYTVYYVFIYPLV